MQRDTLDEQEARAVQAIETLHGADRATGHDMEREEALNRDAGETIERLDWEARELAKAAEGHAERLDAAAAEAR